MPLDEAHSQEVLRFLSRRPFHSAVLAGLISEHGILSPHHRGIFYGHRDPAGDLTGVGLIGRNLLFEAADDDAIAALAIVARDLNVAKMAFADEVDLTRFWDFFGNGQPMPPAARYRLIRYVGGRSVEIEPVDDLRLANKDDLPLVVEAHATMVRDETNEDPMKTDRDGFVSRCLNRIERGKVWVRISEGKLLFKADVLTETENTVYFEGLWVNPGERSKGVCTRSLAALCERLGGRSIFGFAEHHKLNSTSIYKRAGFSASGDYLKIYI